MINKKIIQKFLELAPQKLSGEWVLIGGNVLSIISKKHRATVDIDLAPKNEEGISQQIQLMELSEQLGLPVESINQAGLYFLKKIKNFENKLILIKQTDNFSLFIPNLYLFLQLKTARLNEIDMQDCIEYIQLEQKKKKSLDREKEFIQKLIEKEEQEEKLKRLKKIGESFS